MFWLTTLFRPAFAVAPPVKKTVFFTVSGSQPAASTWLCLSFVWLRRYHSLIALHTIILTWRMYNEECINSAFCRFLLYELQ
jgi:hypothetical protein